MSNKLIPVYNQHVPVYEIPGIQAMLKNNLVKKTMYNHGVPSSLRTE
jgi:hypothetical protein